MKTAIYNCKACKTGLRVLYTESERQHIGYGRYATSRWRIGDRGQRVYPGYNDGDGICKKCSRRMQWNWLEANRVPTVPCDVRCTGARGWKCDCSCGGENHGSAWSNIGRPLKELLTRPEGDVSGARGSRCEHIPPSALEAA